MEKRGTHHLSRCKRHPRATAGWRCEGCEATLCPECVEARRMQTVDLLVCRECGGRAETLLVHRSEQAPLSERLGHAWRYPFTQHGMALVLALGTSLTFFSFMTRVTLIVVRFLPAALTLGVFWGCFFAIVRATARGESDVPIPEYSDLFADWIAPALRGLVATSVLWLPFFLYLEFTTNWDLGQYVDRLLSDPMFYATGRFLPIPGEELLRDPVAWLLGIACILYLPMAFLLAAIGASLPDMLNPVRGLAAIQRLGRDYALTLGTLLTLGLVFFVVRIVSSSVLALDLGIVTRWLAELLDVPVPLMMAHVLGLLLYTRGDVLGYGTPSEYFTPVLPDATPSTTLRLDPAPLPPQAPAASTPAAAQPGPTPEAKVRELAAAVQARDIPQALALYTSLDLPKSAISPALHLFVGQAAATQGDNALAVRALESAADVAPDDPLAPRALVLLARVLGERMRDATRAQDVYRYIVDRYPDTDASRFARARLPPTT